jgi:hypothetical protein
MHANRPNALSPVIVKMVLSCLLPFGGALAQTVPTFAEVSQQVGVSTTHGMQFGPFGESDMMSGGVAGGDIDGDDWTDLLVLRGDLGAARLFRNQGNGHFADEALLRGLTIDSGFANGALLADVDGDGDLDALVGGLYIPDANHVSPPRLWRNDGQGFFVEDTEAFSAWDDADSWSMALADVDGDADLDLAVGRWNRSPGERNHVWLQTTEGFVAADVDLGLAGAFQSDNAVSFTPNFADIDDDGDQDLLFTGDFGHSRIFRNDDGLFHHQTSAAINDENGMGAAVADYDNDGDLDWFVSAIFDNGAPLGNWGTTGNRLYRNLGEGQFEDVTDLAGVRDAGWGWGSCFADFNADGWQDLLVVNGMLGGQAVAFNDDPVRLFFNQGDGRFVEAAAAAGILDTGQGRGVVCFDYDRDGDTDAFIQNGYGQSRMYRNDSPLSAWVRVQVGGRQPNTQAIGGRVLLFGSGPTLRRDIVAGNHFLSASPSDIQFAIPEGERYQRIEIRWPSGVTSVSGYRPEMTVRFSIDSIFFDAFD